MTDDRKIADPNKILFMHSLEVEQTKTESVHELIVRLSPECSVVKEILERLRKLEEEK